MGHRSRSECELDRSLEKVRMRLQAWEVREMESGTLGIYISICIRIHKRRMADGQLTPPLIISGTSGVPIGQKQEGRTEAVTRLLSDISYDDRRSSRALRYRRGSNYRVIRHTDDWTAECGPSAKR